MSGWRLVVRAIDQLGTAKSEQIENACDGARVKTHLQRARELGLIEPLGVRTGTRWRLTQLGHDWIAGKVVEVTPAKHKGQQGEQTKFARTWLGPLPSYTCIEPGTHRSICHFCTVSVRVLRRMTLGVTA